MVEVQLDIHEGEVEHVIVVVGVKHIVEIEVV